MVIADAPARALVIFGDGLVDSVLPTHTHLHALAASGACGFLALRHSAAHSDSFIFELQQLLDMPNYSMGNEDRNTKQHHIPSISERFMGMKAAMATLSEPVASLASNLGFQLITMDNGSDDKVKLVNDVAVLCNPSSKLPAPSSLASQLLKTLGLDGACPEDHSVELLLLHIGSGSGHDKACDQEWVDWIDNLLGEVKNLLHMGTKAADHLYLALVMGYGDAGSAPVCAEDGYPSIEKLDGLPSHLRALRPIQTYRMKDGKIVHDVRENHPLLVVHQMDGVTRRDEAQLLNFEEFQKKGGHLTILADRFLHEIAFKLWKAPKYGA